MQFDNSNSRSGTTFTSNIGRGEDDKLNLSQYANGHYKTKGFDENIYSNGALEQTFKSKSTFSEEVQQKIKSVSFLHLVIWPTKF